LPVTPAPTLPFVPHPAPKSEAETANVFGTDPWANVQATPTLRCMCPSTCHASCAPTPFVPKPLELTYHWNSQTYGTLKDVVIASGCNFGVSNNLTQWLNIVIKEFTHQDVVIGYNTLGNQIQAVDTCIAELMNKFKAAVYRHFKGITEHLSLVQNMSENLAQAIHKRIDHLSQCIKHQLKDMDTIDSNVCQLHWQLKVFTEDNSVCSTNSQTHTPSCSMHTVIAKF
jgi:hypothetical protein